MDDCLFSASLVEEAINLMEQVSELLQNNGIDLTKWLSIHDTFLDKIPSGTSARLKLTLDNKNNRVKECCG